MEISFKGEWKGSFLQGDSYFRILNFIFEIMFFLLLSPLNIKVVYTITFLISMQNKLYSWFRIWSYLLFPKLKTSHKKTKWKVSSLLIHPFMINLWYFVIKYNNVVNTLYQTFVYHTINHNLKLNVLCNISILYESYPYIFEYMINFDWHVLVNHYHIPLTPHFLNILCTNIRTSMNYIGAMCNPPHTQFPF